MSTIVTFDKIDRSFAKIEKFLNLFGHVPFISILSGFIRIGLGFLEIGLGLIIFLVHLFACCLKNKPDQAVRGLIYMIHGFFNIIRGILEIICFNFIFLIIYDFSGLRLSYIGEKNDLDSLNSLLTEKK